MNIRGSLFEMAAGLPNEQWKKLAANRIAHLRHYFWSDNPWQRGLTETLRPISLTTTLGLAMTAALIWNRGRGWTAAFCFMAVVGPLALLHLHVGQAFPQFHILPTPFFALAVMGVLAVGRGPRWLAILVAFEALLQHAYTPILVAFSEAGEFDLSGWFALDSAVEWLLILPLFPWLVLARIALARTRN